MLAYSKLLREKFEQEPSFVESSCAATRIMVKRRQLLEAKEALKALKYDFSRFEEEFHLREEALHMKREQMELLRIQCEETINENEIKQVKALRRLDKEKRAISVLDAEIELLGNQLRQLRTQEETLQNETEKNSRYHNYLLHVVEHLRGTPYAFVDVQDILNRFDTMKKVNHDLKKRQKDLNEEYDETIRNLQELSKAKANEQQQCENEIILLQKRLDELSCLTSKNDSSSAESTQAQHDLMNAAVIGQVRISVKNMLRRFEAVSLRAKRSASHLRSSENETKTPEDTRESNRSTEADIVRLAEYIADYSVIVNERHMQEQTMKK